MPFPSAPPSKLRWLHRFLGNSGDWSYWRHRQCTAMSAPPVAEPNLATQELIFDLTDIIQKWCPIYKTNLWLSNLYTQIETCSPSITEVSSPLQDFLLTSSTRTNRTSGVLQPTSDAQSRLGDFHQQATEEDNQWKHWRDQGGDKANSGTILRKKRYGTKKIITSLHVLAQLILFCLAPCFFKTKDSNTNIWSTAGMLHDPSV